MIPAKLLHYDILAKIGEGGMGVVYKARDRHLDRFVAIKVLNPRWISDPDRRRRFAQEAKAASALNHPNIVTIHDISTDHDVDFIAMEYVEGQTLDHHIGRHGMSPSMALDCAIQTAGALAKAHAAGIVHRDLKPSNIMVTDGGVVKILDFGVAKLIAVDQAPAVVDPAGVTHTKTERGQPRTAEGRIVGTAAYMSPEQAAGQPVDARSDIFSFGTLLYEMTTGICAFAGTSTVNTLAALLNSDPKPPSQLSKHVGRDLERIILRCLRKDPAKRFQATADLVVDLEEIKTATEAAATVSGRTRSLQRTLVMSGIVATVAATGLAAGAMWLSRTSRNRLPPPTIDRLTSYPGNEYSASLSPDGNHVAFSWNGVNEDNLDIYIKPVGGEASLRLTTDPAEDGVPAWSPDGSQIAFVRHSSDQFSIYLTPPVPGSERKILDFRPATTWIGRMTMSWTPDGKWLALTTLGANGAGMSLISIAGGEPRILISNSSFEGSYCYPTISPSGTMLAYALCKAKGGIATDAIPCDVYVSDLDATYAPRGKPRRLTNQQTMIVGITWPHDEKSVIYGSLASGSEYLWRAPLPEGQPERIELAGAAQFPTISRVGDQLAYTRDRADYDIWKFMPGGGVASLFSFTTNDFDPQLSPDGTRVAFVTDRSGRGREIWTATLEGSNAHPVTQATGGYLGSPRWSPDGKWIAFDAVSDGANWDIYVVDAAGGQPRRLTKDPGFENFPSWSRDGKWIYFRSMRTGKSEVWRMRPDGGSPEQITTTGGASAWESWDGETLYYTRHDGFGALGDSPGVFARPVRGGAERQILDSVLAWNFVPTKDGIYYITVAEPRSRRGFELRFLSVVAARSKVISRFQAKAGQGLTVSADGKTILYSGIGPNANADLMIIHNFR